MPLDSSFLALVFLSELDRGFDVSLLTSLFSTAEQDDDLLPVLAEINPIARAEIEPAFEDSEYDSFHRREIALLDTEENGFDSRGNGSVKQKKPTPK